MSRHAGRQALTRGFGATDIVTERGDEGVAQIKELTGGLGAHSVIEAVGTQQSMMQAIRSARPGGHVGFVGVSHDVQLSGDELFFAEVHLHGGPAPVRRFLSELIELIWDRKINPGKVFDLTLPLEEAADGYRAMDRRDAIKVLLQPWRQDGRPLNDLVRRSRGAAGGRRPVGAHPPDQRIRYWRLRPLHQRRRSFPRLSRQRQPSTSRLAGERRCSARREWSGARVMQ
jgi:hypothetical protein